MIKKIIGLIIIFNINYIAASDNINKFKLTKCVSCPNLTNITDVKNIIVNKPTAHIVYKNKSYNKYNKMLYLREREKNNFNMF